jgi:hypothetical protein
VRDPQADPLFITPASTMTIFIGSLIALSCFLGMRLYASSSENTALRASIALLKRRLEQLS